MEKRNPKLIRTIRQGIKDLGLKDYEYRAIYERVTGKSSISGDGKQKGMNNKELGRVIEALKLEGFKLKAKHKGVVLCKSPQARRIRSLWLELKELGELRDSSEETLLKFVSKHTYMEKMEDAADSQLQHVIEIMKRWVARVEDARLNEAPPGSALAQAQ